MVGTAGLAGPRRKRWTREEYQLLDSVLPGEYKHLELVEGEVLTRMGAQRPHAIASHGVQWSLSRIFGMPYIEIGSPIDVAPQDNQTNEPVPDLIVLTKRSWEIPVDNPQPSEIRLVVEISDSTLSFDLTVRAALYARAGIIEY